MNLQYETIKIIFFQHLKVLPPSDEHVLVGDNTSRAAQQLRPLKSQNV